MSRTSSGNLISSILAIFLLAAASVGQTTNGSIVGDIVDAQRAAVVGATVTVKEVDTGVTRTVASDTGGSYRVFPLPPGRYEVAVSAAGFKKQVQPNVTLDIAAT